ncbi:MAG TPA: FtsX-like permease family protein [Chryseolinea sp.]|nr:FtsX-like permease family protein [Chryseolinea sp.]
MLGLLIKSSIRILKKQFTLSTVKISGLSMGMATFLITSLYCLHEWSFDKQHPGWENIYRYIHRVKSQDDLQSFAFTSATTGPALKGRYSEVEDFTRILGFEVSLKRKDSDVGFVEKKFAFADANFVQFFSFPLRHGTDPKILSEPYSVILTPASAEKYFGSFDPVGKALLLNGLIELTVKDVFKSNFSRSHIQFDFIASLATLESIKNHPIVSKQIPAALNLENKGFAAFYTYLRLTSTNASETLEKRFPAFIEEFRGKGRSERLKPTLQSLASIHLNSDMLYEIDKNGSHAIVTIYIIVGLLILVTAIINYINISTAEFFMRAKNVGLKKILGINKSALLLGHLVETMVVCAVAVVSGGFLAWLLIPSFNTIMQTQLVFFSKDSILPFVLVYTTTVVMSGLLPAVQILRQDALIAFGGKWKTGTSTAYLRNSLVFLQLMTSFILLAIALLIVRQTDYLLQRDTGFDTEQVMVVNTSGMPSNERIAFKHKLALNQYVANVSMCSTPPGESLFTFGLTLPGANGDEDKRITFYHMFVDENFLDALGVELQDGRFFNADVPGDSVNSFVVNQTAAKAIHDSLMTRLIEIPNIYTGKRSHKTVVGVIDDFHFASFHTAVEPLILEYNPTYARYLLVRFHPSNAKAIIELLDRMWKVDAPLLPLNYYFLDETFGRFYATEQRTKQIVMIVSLLAVCLASLGIFGTSLFVIQQRTKEIGVRKLLGSATNGLFILLFRPIFLIFFAACAAGVPIALWVGDRWLAGYPYRANFSVIILLISFTIIFVVMLLTISSYLFRIGRVQPAEVLKSQ